jgi:hypothetical protein
VMSFKSAQAGFSAISASNPTGGCLHSGPVDEGGTLGRTGRPAIPVGALVREADKACGTARPSGTRRASKPPYAGSRASPKSPGPGGQALDTDFSVHDTLLQGSPS